MANIQKRAGKDGTTYRVQIGMGASRRRPGPSIG